MRDGDGSTSVGLIRAFTFLRALPLQGTVTNRGEGMNQPARPRPLLLAVDDSPRDLNLLVSILEHQGYELARATEGSQALTAAARDLPDLILLDILMPGMGGLETCQKLKADASTQGIPVIFLSGQSDADQVLAGFGAGAVDYVTKPFQIPELLARVRVHVDLHRAQQELRTLHGILPTCSHCKKIRDEEGAWHAFEVYISRRSEAQFSHGLCPECIPIFFPSFSKESRDNDWESVGPDNASRDT